MATLQAQYVNTDSLALLTGFTIPVSLGQLDSFHFEFPAVEKEYQNFQFNQQSLNDFKLVYFTIPSDGKVISRFGLRSGRIHTGTDMKLNKGDTIFAAFEGIVERAGYYSGYGNLVVVGHGNSLETYYAHLSGFLVNSGETIRQNQPLGLAGSTGRATTNHLHFEIRENDKPYDPELVFDFEKNSVRKEVAGTNSLFELQQKLKTNREPGIILTEQRYIIKPGDSLWKISRLFKTSVNTLCLLNNLDEKSILNVGAELMIY